MKRPLFWTLLITAVAATALAAQEQQPGGDKGDKKEPVDKSKDIMTRLAKNLAIVEGNLKKVDPGDETRKIQREIIDDLEELIKQNSKQQGSGGGKSKKNSKPDQGDQKDESDTNKGGQNDKKSDGNPDKNGQKDGQDDNKGQVKPGKGDQGEGKDKDKGQGKEGDDKEGVAKTGGKDQDKKGDKDNKKGEVKADDSKDNGGQQTAGGKAKQDPPQTAKKNLLADLHREVWGHLPDKMRLEMDAYSKERFMPRYEDLLQQYYRTIAEQASGKEK